MQEKETIQQSILELSARYQEEVVEHRRYFHRFPELSFEEKETSAYISRYLEQMDVPFRSGFAGYGLVAELSGGGGKGRTIALRADMDALPITENTSLEFASKHPGKMHACGHDMHMASLMGTLKIMHSLRSEWPGKILFVFQPGEEVIPGGAKQMLEEGALRNPTPELIIGQHVLPELPAGKVGFRPGKYMASSDEIYLTLLGKGGHAALPEELINPLMMAAALLPALEELIRINQPEGLPTILSFGKITGAGATNIVPDRVELEGTFRTMDESWREKAHGLIRSAALRLCREMGGDCILDIRKGYPSLENDPVLTRKAIQYARVLLGEDNVVPLDIRMGAEDFAWYAQTIPAVFYRMGTGIQGTPPSRLHSSGFIANEEALLTGCAAMAWLAFSFLTETSA